MSGFESKVVQKIVSDEQEFLDIRHQIHSAPEIGFDTFRTAELVSRYLQDWGYEVHSGIGGSGVVGQFKKGTGSRSLGIRADMDALSIHEQTNLPYASTVPGRMHACGHDGHTTILLAAAKFLAQDADFDGTLNLIFQPAEENLSGSRAMIADGLFDRFPCDAVFALHNAPGIPVGQFLLRKDGAMAAADTVKVTLKGLGGHGTMPANARDPIVALAAIVTAVQTIVSRNVPASKIAVITIAKITAGSGDGDNVIPQEAEMILHVRSMDPNVRSLMEARIRELVHHQAASFGVEATIDYRQLAPVLMNSPEPTTVARGVLVELAGYQNVLQEADDVLASDDFAWMCQSVPGCYIIAGNGVGDEGGCAVHNPAYDFNDRLISLCASLWVNLTEAYLS